MTFEVFEIFVGMGRRVLYFSRCVLRKLAMDPALGKQIKVNALGS